MSINMNIERLVLDGIEIPPHQRPALQAAVECELASLLVENGIARRWGSGGAVPRLSADTIQLQEGATPEELGRQIAQSIYEELQR